MRNTIMRNTIMRDTIDFISDKLNGLSRRGKIALLTALTAATAISASQSFFKEDDYVYLVDLTDKFEDDASLVDKDGKEIDIDTNDRSKLLAIVDEKKTKKGKQYQTILVNEQGEMFSGYMDGKYLDDKSIDKVKVRNAVLAENNVVYAQSGLWLRDNDKKEIDHHTDDAYCLPEGSYIATSDVFETSKDNSYQWKEAVYVDGDELKHGYVVGDYIRSNNFSDIEGKKFEVSSQSGLKLRDSASLDSEIVYQIGDGEKVVLLPNVPSVSDDQYDWFYVAVNTDEGIKVGYAAATYYTSNGVINYLNYQGEKEDFATKKSQGEMLIKVVDTSSDSGVDLKLREEPGLDSKIISEIENGTKVYTFQEALDISSMLGEVDGHNWVQIYLTNGKSGYVASDYIKNDKVERKDNSSAITLEFGENEGKITGYYGIDVNNVSIPTDFEALITNDYDYTSSAYSVSRDVFAIKRPEFVMFKLGATYTSSRYETATLATDNFTCLDKIQSMVAICEENHVPYGFYYYSQAINEKDADIEAEFIHEALSQIGTSKYNVLPFAIDVEDYVYVNGQNIPTRVLEYTRAYGKESPTKAMNYLMNRVREENDMEVISYLSHSGYTDLIDHEDLDKINQKNSWIVNPSSVHSDIFSSQYPDVLDNTIMRQIALDGSYKGVPFDINLMNKSYFDKVLKENNLAKSDLKTENKVLAKTN